MWYTISLNLSRSEVGRLGLLRVWKSILMEGIMIILMRFVALFPLYPIFTLSFNFLSPRIIYHIFTHSQAQLGKLKNEFVRSLVLSMIIHPLDFLVYVLSCFVFCLYTLLIRIDWMTE